MNAQPNTSCTLRNFRRLLQGIIYAIDAIVFHGKQETRTHLWLRCTCIEQRRCCVGHVLLAHQLVRLNCTLEIVLVYTYTYTHQHMLRTFYNLAVHAQ